MKEAVHPEQQKAYVELAKLLRDRLYEKDMKVTVLAKIIDFDKGLVGRVLNGRQIPSVEVLASVVSALEIPFKEHVYLEALAGRVHPDISADVRVQIAQEIHRRPFRQEIQFNMWR